MEVNAEPRAHSALPSMEDPSVFCGQKVGWVRAPGWMLNWRALFLSLSVIEPSICKQRIALKGCYLRAKLHGVTSHKAVRVIYCYSSLIVQCKFSHPVSSKSQSCFSYYSLFCRCLDVRRQMAAHNNRIDVALWPTPAQSTFSPFNTISRYCVPPCCHQPLIRSVPVRILNVLSFL